MTNREYAESKNIHGLMDSGADLDAPLEEWFKDFIDAIVAVREGRKLGGQAHARRNRRIKEMRKKMNEREEDTEI